MSSLFPLCSLCSFILKGIHWAFQTETLLWVVKLWEILLVYSFSNSLSYIFLCSPFLELIYVGFLTARIESPICLSLLFPSLSPPTPCTSILGRFLWLSLLSLLLVILLQFQQLAIIVLKYAYLFAYWFFCFLFCGCTVCAYFSKHIINVFLTSPCFILCFFIWINSFYYIFLFSCCSSCCRIISIVRWCKWLNINALHLYLRAM